MSCFAVIMAGGWGERFWPVSRVDRPKQLLRLTASGKTMLEEAVARVVPVVTAENVYIATSSALRGPIEAELGEIRLANLLVEPAKRNTAGAICWVLAHLMHLAADDDDHVVAFLTADHAITTEAQFQVTFGAAVELAMRTDGLVTIGIKPTRPETGYGYLQCETHDFQVSAPTFRVAKFHEKPTESLAESYLRDGGFLWNAGMFVGKVTSFLNELREHAPEAASRVAEIADALRINDVAGAEAAFCALPDISIDYLLMEKSGRVFCVEALFTWDDLGSWDALERAHEPDQNGNVLIGRSCAVDSNRNIVFNESGRAIVATLGVSDLVIVATDDAILVTDKRQSQNVRKVARQVHADTVSA